MQLKSVCNGTVSATDIDGKIWLNIKVLCKYFGLFNHVDIFVADHTNGSKRNEVSGVTYKRMPCGSFMSVPWFTTNHTNRVPIINAKVCEYVPSGVHVCGVCIYVGYSFALNWTMEKAAKKNLLVMYFYWNGNHCLYIYQPPHCLIGTL